LKLLNKAAPDITQLVQQVDVFVDWWLHMETILLAMGGKLFIDTINVNRIRVQKMKDKWTGIKGKYSGYKMNVSFFMGLD